MQSPRRAANARSAVRDRWVWYWKPSPSASLTKRTNLRSRVFSLPSYPTFSRMNVRIWGESRSGCSRSRPDAWASSVHCSVRERRCGDEVVAHPEATSTTKATASDLAIG